MKYLASALALTLCVASVGAQDLVKNPSFEYDVSTPVKFDQIEFATGWDNANGGTVDLYSSAATKYTVGIPDNHQGSQETFDGQSYAGIIAYQDDQACDLKESMMNMSPTPVAGYQKYSEYIECELAEALVPGRRYRITYQASLSDNSTRAISNLGAALSDTRVAEKSNAFLDIEPAFVNPQVVSDKTGWTEISGVFTAQGGEKFLIIGVFNADEMTKTNLSETGKPDFKRAYYYIDGLTMLPSEGVDFNKILDGDNVILTKLNFDLGKASIRKESYPQLDEFAGWLKRHNDVGVSIDGHTDKSGTPELNQKLSKERAEAVKKYLVSRGVKSTIITKGFGNMRPLVKGGAEVNEKNRRVEISLIK